MSAKKGEQRQSDHQGEQAWQHQDLERVQAHGPERIDLLVNLHHSDLGREGAAGAAGDHHRGQQNADLAQRRDRKQVDREDLRAKAAQLVGALIRHDDTDQESDQPHDRQRIDAGLLQVMHERRQAQPAWLQGEPQSASTVWP